MSEDIYLQTSLFHLWSKYVEFVAIWTVRTVGGSYALESRAEREYFLNVRRNALNVGLI